MDRGDVGDRPYEAAVLDALPVGVLAVAPDGSIGWASWRAAELLGVPADELVATDLLGLLPRGDRVALCNVLARAADGPALLVGPLVVDGHLRHPLRRGSTWSVSEHGQPDLRGVLCLVVDESSERAAQLDPLTGAAHRSVLTDGSLDDATPKAVLCLDVDRFHEVNDAHGRRAGDQVLIELVRRLASVLRPTDTLARLDGDAFAALCAGISERHQVERVAERIVDAIEQPFDLGEDELLLHVTIGMSVGDGTKTADLLEAADDALRDAKASKRGWAFRPATHPGR